MIEKMIINADDFGLASGVNQGIIECHEAGVVTSTTLMVQAPGAIEAAGLAADHPSLGVGLHLNLTSGRPVLPAGQVPSLVNRAGAFPGRWTAAARLTTGRARTRELAAEIGAQIDRCRELGIEPTHADSHHHIHAHPRLRRVLNRVCLARGIGKVRAYHMVSGSVFRPWKARRGAPARASGPGTLLLAACELLAPGKALESPTGLFGVESMAGYDYALSIEPLLAAGAGTLEVMCHPGHVDPVLEEASSYTHGREAELGSLLSRDMKQMLENSGARLVSYRDL